MSKQVILTGIRANNDLHIGNYFGALMPIVDMAKKHAGQYQINLFMPDLHSFTTPIDHNLLQAQIRQALRLFVAAGMPLEHPDVNIYRQSYVPAHSELTVILNCFTGVGEMERMTQYKDKAAKMGNDRVSVGLFDYPVLMAADVLLYGGNYVPVGDDQSQHLEIIRDLAQRMNAKFQQDLFVVPHEVKKQHQFFGKDQGLRIKDLVDPSKKMSKSDDTGKGIIFLNDSPNEATKKIMSATTDSVSSVNFDPQKQPGISNLLQILALASGKPLDEIINKYSGQTNYGDLKADLAGAIAAFLTEFQTKLAAVNQAALDHKLVESEAAMNKSANKTLLRVQKAVGLRV
ncbi:MAG: tryptophan--tRNA ligase [Candidatus Saccharimonadales bacterium]